jgi:hypothetical protein
VDPATGRQLPGATDDELAALVVTEKDAFDEEAWVAEALQVGGWGAVTARAQSRGAAAVLGRTLSLPPRRPAARSVAASKGTVKGMRGPQSVPARVLHSSWPRGSHPTFLPNPPSPPGPGHAGG